MIASGDLTHRGRRDQHERAAAFLRELGPPVLAVPGNHDIPYTLPGALHAPRGASSSASGQTTEPVYVGERVHVVGLNSVRPWRHQSGGVSDAQLERVAERLRRRAPGALRVVALHHQLIGAPWRIAEEAGRAPQPRARARSSTRAPS